MFQTTSEAGVSRNSRYLESSDDDLVRRALKAYLRLGNVPFPANYSGLAEHNGLTYVKLENCNGTLAVYRVKNDGRLKRLERWPRALEA